MIYEYAGDWFCEACAPRNSHILLTEKHAGSCANCGEPVENTGEEVNCVCPTCGSTMDLVSSEGGRMIMACEACGQALVYTVPDEELEEWEWITVS